ADRAASDLPRAPVRGLHDARPTPGHDRESRAGQARAELTAHHVVGMRFGEARGAEYRDARAHEVEGPEAAHELTEDPDGAPELGAPSLRPSQELDLLRRARGLPPRPLTGPSEEAHGLHVPSRRGHRQRKASGSLRAGAPATVPRNLRREGAAPIVR